MQDQTGIALAGIAADLRDLARVVAQIRDDQVAMRREMAEARQPVVEVAEADRRALVELLPAIGIASGGWWSVAALHRLAKDSPALARALRVHPDRRALGRLFGRAEGAVVGDWLIERSARDGREGALRRVTFCLR